jgi:hypothetical protein
MKFFVVLFLFILGLTAPASASNSVSCNGGAFTVISGPVVVAGGGSYIPVVINIASAGVLQYFAKNGFTFPATSTPPPGVRTRVAMNQPSFESYKYQFHDAASNIWFFERRGNGMIAIAETGDAGRSVNWYFENCTFQ